MRQKKTRKDKGNGDWRRKERKEVRSNEDFISKEAALTASVSDIVEPCFFLKLRDEAVGWRTVSWTQYHRRTYFALLINVAWREQCRGWDIEHKVCNTSPDSPHQVLMHRATSNGSVHIIVCTTLFQTLGISFSLCACGLCVEYQELWPDKVTPGRNFRKIIGAFRNISIVIW
jgi:hypothetical protein